MSEELKAMLETLKTFGDAFVVINKSLQDLGESIRRLDVRTRDLQRELIKQQLQKEKSQPA